MFDFASRIAKLDAISLDDAFLSFLKREITEIITSITGDERCRRYSPEINLLIRFIIWKFTTSSGGSTFGQKLLGVKYADFSGRLKLLFVLEGVIPYLIERLQSIRDRTTVENIRLPLKTIQNAFKVLHILNFCIFLVQNRYPTVASRLLRLPIVPVNGRFNPAAGYYYYQIRELLWHQFADFLIMILPMVNFQKLKRSVLQWFGSGQTNAVAGTHAQVPNDHDETTLQCSVCNEDAVIPQRVGNESYCYFCYHSIFEN